MECRNHTERLAADRCAGCAEPFCPDCLVEIHGQKYCGSCKVMAVKGQPQLVEAVAIPCKEASDALKLAIVGIFCVGVILEPVALVKALKAKKLIQVDPRLTGTGKANAAMIIAIVSFVLWVLGVLSKIAHV